MFFQCEGVVYRLTVDNHFIENVLALPLEQKESSSLWKLLMLGYRLKETANYDLLWTSPQVKKYIVDNYGENKSEMIALLFQLLINIDSTINEESMIHSIKLCASKIGIKNYLVTPETTVMKNVFGVSSFEVISGEDALNLMDRLVETARITGLSS